MTVINAVAGVIDVEAIEARAAAVRPPIQWRRFFIALLCVIPAMLGMAVGRTVRGGRLMRAAFMDGYDRGSASPARLTRE